MSNKTPILPLDQDLPPHLLANLIASVSQHTQNVQARQAELGPYPDPATVTEFDEVTDEDLPLITFPGTSRIVDKTEPDSFRKGKRNRRRGSNQGGGKNGKPQGGGKTKSGGGGGGGSRSLPDPKMVHGEVAQMLQGVPLAGMTGNIQVGELNCEFMDGSKAIYFADAYKEVISRFHVVFLSEVSKSGVAELAKNTGYTGECSVENNRSQAVAFVVHPRIKVVGNPISYSSVANVQGIPDLRPAFRLDLEDTVSGEKFSVVVLHLKSMRGGPAVTAVVRCKQFALLVNDLGTSFAGIVGGDLNYNISDPNCREADPMIKAGFALIAPNDKAATQIMGTRIDGLFIRGMTSKVDFYRVYAFFSNPKLKRSFTDHAALSVEILTSSSKSNGSQTATKVPELCGTPVPVIRRARSGEPKATTKIKVAKPKAKAPAKSAIKSTKSAKSTKAPAKSAKSAKGAK